MSEQTISQIIASAFEEVKTADVVRQEQLCVWGGSFESARLSEFLQLWEKDLSGYLHWRIYQYVSRLEVEKSSVGAPPDDLDWLERARCFSEDGDLDLRRDRETIYWRFLGNPAITWPDLKAADFECCDFWNGRQDYWVREFVVKTVQWQWRDGENQVGGQWLCYGPLLTQPSTHTIVYLNQRHYIRGGRVEFVRFTGLEAK
jgi:hypothetical protein